MNGVDIEFTDREIEAVADVRFGVFILRAPKFFHEDAFNDDDMFMIGRFNGKAYINKF